MCEQLKELNGKHAKSIDHWLLSKVHGHLKHINAAMKSYDLRELASTVYFGIYDDLRWYVRRGGNDAKTLKEVLSLWCKVMNPITPHLSEELNFLGGYLEGLVSASEWPEVDETKIQLKAEAGEELVKNTTEGMRNVLKLAKIETPQKFTLFVAEPWLYPLFEIVSSEIKVTHNLGEIMRKVLAVPDLESRGKDISKIVPGLLKDVSKVPRLVTSPSEEAKVMKEANEYLEKEFGCKVEVVLAEESENPKAKSALPGKLGILVE